MKRLFTSDQLQKGIQIKFVIKFQCSINNILAQDPAARVACETAVTTE